jgi:putative ABC transport system permease protein
MPLPLRTPLGWLQLRHRPVRLLVAIAGISFAVMLILMQLGFRAALFESTLRFHERFRYDIALFSADSVFIVRPQAFSIRRLYQALAVGGVSDVTPVYIRPAVWKNPWTNDRRNINAVGFNPQDAALATPGLDEALPLLRRQDVVLFDQGSRPEFGPVAERLQADEKVITEINDREIEVAALFEIGPSFGIDGTVVTSDDNWLRLFPDWSRDDIHLGLIRLADSANTADAQQTLQQLLPEDVLVLTRAQFIAQEKAYWNSATPIGYVFTFGAIMGFVVGAIIVYQILFADVSEHLREYGTLRALGYPNRFVSGIVLQQAAILGVLGFIPGAAAATWLHGQASAATLLPLYVSPDRAATVFLMTVAMCAVSGMLALRRVRRLDPAEVF